MSNGVKKVDGIKAAVFMSHAFNDWNVVPEHSVRIYEALKGRVPLRAYFHQGGHGGAPPLEMMNKWFTRYLYGVDNGVEREPKAETIAVQLQRCLRVGRADHQVIERAERGCASRLARRQRVDALDQRDGYLPRARTRQLDDPKTAQ